MKFFLFKDEKLKLEVTDPTSFNKAYRHRGRMEFRVFQMETTVTNLQPSEHREDPEQKQFFAELMKKLCHPESAYYGSAKKRRIERNTTLKISMGVPNKVSDRSHENQAVIKIDGGFITALHQLCFSLPAADVRVKLTLLTDLFIILPFRSRLFKRDNFSVTTNEMRIYDKTYDCPEYCDFYFYLPNPPMRSALVNSNDGKKLTQIDGIFNIEISLINFQESLVSPKILNQTILEDVESADVVICSGDGKEIPCHRNFLTVNSVVLKAMLQSSFQESSGKIKMPDMSEEGVRAFLAFLYYRDLAPAKKKISIVGELLNAGEKYNVIPLRTSMEKLLLEIHEDSWWWTVEATMQIFAFMDKIESHLKETVKEKIIRVMKRNYAEWMASEVYQKILKEDPAIISELLKAAFSLWSYEQPVFVDVDSD